MTRSELLATTGYLAKFVGGSVSDVADFLHVDPAPPVMSNTRPAAVVYCYERSSAAQAIKTLANAVIDAKCSISGRREDVSTQSSE